MTVSQPRLLPYPPETSRQLIGSLGRIIIFLWALMIILLTQREDGIVLAGTCVLILGLLHPSTLKRLLRLRWLILLGLLLAANILFGGGRPDLEFWGMPLSTENLIVGGKMVFSAIIIFLAMDGLAAAMDITEMAGLFERFGLQGLGFSLGVGINMLPNLRQSGMNAWHSLRMRGGMRAQWWRGMQLLLLTVLTNALRRSEDIVLAAEARAFRPDRSRSVPLRIGRLDWWLIPLAVLSLPAILLLA